MLEFFIAALVIGIAPGPDNLFVLAQSATYGARLGFCIILGLCTGIALQICLRDCFANLPFGGWRFGAYCCKPDCVLCDSVPWGRILAVPCVQEFWRESRNRGDRGRCDRIQQHSVCSQALLPWGHHEHDEPEGDSLYSFAYSACGAFGSPNPSESANGKANRNLNWFSGCVFVLLAIALFVI